MPDLQWRNTNRNLIHARHDFEVEFAAIRTTLQAPSTPGATADDIVRYVRAQLDADYGSITMIRSRKRLETIAPTDRLATQLDRLQAKFREGPCYDSSWHAQTLRSTNLAADKRWPRWSARATALGIASLLAVELTTIDNQRLGSINVYWTRLREFTPDDAAFMNIFARHAALAMAQARNDDSLNTALDARKLIGQAQGILMERYSLDETKAFELMRRYSEVHNIKLRDVAAYLKATQQLPS